MKATLLLAAVPILFCACDVKVNNPPAEKKVEKETTIINPPAKEEKKVENNTTIVNPPPAPKEEKKIETNTTIINPPPKEEKK
jgi:hypothetical protein